MPDQLSLARAAVPVTVLAAEEDGDKGLVEAIVSAYNVRYRIGFATYHTIQPGGFAASIAEQAAIPLFWMHAWDWTEQPPIGHGAASEVDDPKPGLKITGEMYLDQPGVMSVFRAMKAGALREWSIGYRVLAFDIDPDDDLHLFVTEAELLEASSVLRGANPGTETLQVASQYVTYDEQTGLYTITPPASPAVAAGSPGPPRCPSAVEEPDAAPSLGNDVDDVAEAERDIVSARLTRRSRHVSR